MFKKFMQFSGLLILGWAASAHAGIAGWGVRIGSVDVYLNLTKVPNPKAKPTLAKVQADLTQIEYICVNPNDHSVLPGESGRLTYTATQPLTDQSSSLVDEKGNANLKFSFNITQPYACVNSNWTFIQSSQAAKRIDITINWDSCTGDKTNPCAELVNRETVKGHCTLDNIQRYDDPLHDPAGMLYQPIPGQEYMCEADTP